MKRSLTQVLPYLCAWCIALAQVSMLQAQKQLQTESELTLAHKAQTQKSLFKAPLRKTPPASPSAEQRLINADPFKAYLSTTATPSPFPPRVQYRSIPSAALMQAVAEGGSVTQVKKAQESGLPIFLQYQPQDAQAHSQLRGKQAITASTRRVLKEISAYLPVENPEEVFEIQRFEKDELGHTHVRLQQHYQDLPIYGAEALLHFQPGDKVLFNGRYTRTPALSDVTPVFNGAEAINIAKTDLQVQKKYQELSARTKEMIQYYGPEVELLIYALPGTVAGHHLAYHVSIRANIVENWFYFIDAQSGEILNAYNRTCSIGPTTTTGTHLDGTTHTVGTFDAGNNTFALIDMSKDMFTGTGQEVPNPGQGSIITLDLGNDLEGDPSFVVSNNNSTWNQIALSAHINASICYDYFNDVHGHQSINGQGGDVISFINVPDPETGQAMDNAFWDGRSIYYGNGRQFFDPLAGSLDVGGHEMTHGVIQATANLEYQDQPGALNESFADIFGVMIDREDFLLGEDVVSNGALRDMQFPNNGNQPKDMSEFVNTTEDNGGVHINSGIVNRAFVLVALAIGKEDAERIYFRALDRYLTRFSQFIDCRIAVIQAATDLFGGNSAQVLAIGNAYDIVGILEGDPTPVDTDIPSSTGAELLINIDTNPFESNKIWIANAGQGTLSPISTTNPLRPISVEDSGRFAVFVDRNKALRIIGTNPAAAANEQLLNASPIWGNAAISKDGTRLATVTDEADASITVFDLVTETQKTFQLFNPTTAQGGIDASGVLFADAIEFDYSGEFILYDAFNRIGSSTGNSNLEFWDVGLIKVWDNETQTFASGENIIKVFSNLPQGVSLGNARFAKNDQLTIVFDYFEERSGQADLNRVMAANLATGDIGTLFDENAVLGFPSYSSQDDQVAFTAISNQGDTVLAVRDLATPLSPAGSASILISDAKWPVFYTLGGRAIPTAIDESLVKSGSFALYPNPSADHVRVDFQLTQSAQVAFSLSDLMGRTLQAQPKQLMGAGVNHLEVDLSALATGTYLAKLEVAGQVEYKKLVKY